MNKFYSLLQTGVSAVALVCLSSVSYATDVSNEGELKAALQAGNDVNLTSDITLTGALPEVSGGSFTINGNSYKIFGGEGRLAGMDIGDEASVNFSNVVFEGLNRAIVNSGKIGVIDNVKFINNYDSGSGGAISNNGSIKVISNSVFSGNSVVVEAKEDGQPSQYEATGGAIYNYGSDLTLVNTSFIGNYVELKGGPIESSPSSPSLSVFGGAIYSQNGSVQIVAQDQDVVFAGNYVKQPQVIVTDREEGGENVGEMSSVSVDGSVSLSDSTLQTVNNAITVVNGDLNFVTDNGNIAIYDGVLLYSIGGDSGDINISGTGKVYFGGEVRGSLNLNLISSEMYLGEYARVTTENFYATNDSVLSITVNPDKGMGSVLLVDGDVKGSPKVVVYTTNDSVLSPDKSILFVDAAADDKSTAGDFVVYRVYGSPYMWHSEYRMKTEDPEAENAVLASGWYLTMGDEMNPDYRPMAPEIASFLALHSIAVEQNRGMLTSVRNAAGNNKVMLKRYGLLYEDGYLTKNVSRAWLNPVYRYVQLTAPQKLEATIMGVDAGLDVQADASNKLGVFVSYRDGSYDIGKEGYYKTTLDSTIDVTSYSLGLYYRYDYNNFWVFNTAYFGRQNADMRTEDALKADSDAFQIGAGMEVGYAMSLSDTLTLEPSLGVFYTGIDYDDMRDEYGKSADYSMLHQIEGEFGVKLEKTIHHNYGFSKLYIKPSVVQTLNFGNEADITFLNKVETVDDQTLGRIEIGGRYAVDNQMSLYGYVNYTTGTDYDDVAAGLGFNYRFY